VPDDTRRLDGRARHEGAEGSEGRKGLFVGHGGWPRVMIGSDEMLALLVREVYSNSCPSSARENRL
jgi:hypothetical protein